LAFINFDHKHDYLIFFLELLLICTGHLANYGALLRKQQRKNDTEDCQPMFQVGFEMS